jgi:hypothetical protein
MKKPTNIELGRWIAVFCLGLPSFQNQAAQFVEISAEIETFGYRLEDTNSIAKARPRTFTVVCITGTNEWSIENDFQQREQWAFDSTNVLCRTRFATEAWKSRDGNPLRHFGVNIPWLAFCSGTNLKREGRSIPLAAALLRNCPDRFAYTDVTTTFDDEFALPKSIDLFTSRSFFLASHADFDKEYSFGDRYAEWEKKTASNLGEGVLVFHYAVLDQPTRSGGTFRRDLSSSKLAARTSKTAIGSATAPAGLNSSDQQPGLWF